MTDISDWHGKFSKSEEAGIASLPQSALCIYSVGVSTGGIAEIRMAGSVPNRKVIASTIDKAGIEFARKLIEEKDLSDRVEVRWEDVSQRLSYGDDSFDYVYARLILHYLPKDDLVKALAELYRILKKGAKIFIVVRSTDCPEVSKADATYDPTTGFTTVPSADYPPHLVSRFFHSQSSIREYVEKAGFEVESIRQYDEQLYKDFRRTDLSDTIDNLIELIAVK